MSAPASEELQRIEEQRLAMTVRARDLDRQIGDLQAERAMVERQLRDHEAVLHGAALADQRHREEVAATEAPPGDDAGKGGSDAGAR